MEKKCGTCVCGRRAGRDGIWCLMFGIMINRNHGGCRAWDGGDRHEGKGPEEGMVGRSGLRETDTERI